MLTLKKVIGLEKGSNLGEKSVSHTLLCIVGALFTALSSLQWSVTVSSECSANNYVATYKNEERKGGLYRTGEIKGGRDNSYSCCESCNARTALLLRYVSCCSWVN